MKPRSVSTSAAAPYPQPRLSNHARRGTDKGFSLGQRAGGKAPGPLGRLFSKSFGKSRQAADKSHSAGQRARSKAPF